MSNQLLLLLSFYHSEMEELSAKQLAAIVQQLNIPFTLHNGQILFLMSQVSTAQGYERRHFAKNFAFTGKNLDMPGYSQLLEGRALEGFKRAYRLQNGESLTYIKSAWVGDPYATLSFLSKQVKIDTGYQLLMGKILEAYADVTEDEFDDWAA